MGEVERLADEIAAGAPRPSAAAAELEAKHADARDPRWANLRDKQGHSFDPSLHQTNPDGSPKLSRAGRLQGLPGRPLPRRGGSRVAEPSAAAPKSKTPPLVDADRAGSSGDALGGDASPELSAQVVVDLTTHLCVLALGPEWEPRREKVGAVRIDERAQLIQALSRYFEATGIRDIPPGVLLAVTVGGYVIPRLTQPATRSRLRSAWERVRGWFRRRRAYPDFGHHGERENDPGEGAGVEA